MAYNSEGKVIDFGALEIQAVYISGNVRRPFEYYMGKPAERFDMDWRKEINYPRPDYLSSSRKRLVPQLLYKGGIINAWKKKIAVALDEGFFATLPHLKDVKPEQADIAWLVYKIEYNEIDRIFSLKRVKTYYTQFNDSLDKIAKPEIGSSDDFIMTLQEKLNSKLEENAPDTKTINLERLNDIGTG